MSLCAMQREHRTATKHQDLQCFAVTAQYSASLKGPQMPHPDLQSSLADWAHNVAVAGELEAGGAQLFRLFIA
jgi:hypothetical protein